MLVSFVYRKEPLAMKRKSAETFGVRYVSVKKKTVNTGENT